MLNHLAPSLPQRPTARRRVVAVLTQEILTNPDSEDFLIASEHQLCRRFGVSRVTIRLALSDLEHQGLIYRRHGKGTFAHGCSKRVHRNLGLLFKAPDVLQHTPLMEMIRGAYSVLASLRSSLVLIGTSPLEWQPELASRLAGVIIIHEGVTDEELDAIKKRNLPIVFFQESRLTAGDDDFFKLGQRAAGILSHAAMTGEPVEEAILS